MVDNNTKDTTKGEIVIFKDSQGPEIQVTLEHETVWLSTAQMAQLFQKDERTISAHIRHIYKEKELVRNGTSYKQANTQNTSIGFNKPTNYYNLDLIISVGYRVNSKRGTQFRMWATARLREYLVKGYSINQQRLKENQDAKLKELEQANKLFLQVIESRRAEGYEKELLKIITDYTNTWFVLNEYDKGTLVIESVSKVRARPVHYEQLQKSIAQFKKRLYANKKANDLFGVEVGEKFQALLGSIYQTYDGKDLYPSIDEKAAHLLYFVIKDHPFADGNKRIGSLLFLLYLVENNYLYSIKAGERKINDTALAALALLVAESKPEQKDTMIKLVVNLINRK